MIRRARGDRLGEGKATVEEQASDLTDNRRSVIDHPLPGAVHRLNVLLLDRLLRDVGNVWLPCCCDDRFSVITVILLAANKRLHILGADDRHAVSERLELTRPIEGACAGFDDDRTARDVTDNGEELLAKHPTLVDCPAAPVDPVQLEDVLCQVDTQHLDLHLSSPLGYDKPFVVGGWESRPSH